MKALILTCVLCLLGVPLLTGCGSDQKDVNKNKEKPQPAAK